MTSETRPELLAHLETGGPLPPEPGWRWRGRPERPPLLPLLVIGGAWAAAVTLRLVDAWQKAHAE